MEAQSERVLGRDDILAASDLPPERLQIPEWGGAVYVRGLTVAEADEHNRRLVLLMRARQDEEERAPPEVRAWVLMIAVVDAGGRRLFTDADLPRLGGKSRRAVEPIYDRVLQISGMMPEAMQVATARLEPSPDANSGTS